MRLFLLTFEMILIISANDLQEFELDEEFLLAKSPIDSQFSLQIIESNFPGLYDNVFAGIESRIAGGQMAEKGQFPYQILMYMKDSKGNTFICGGGLLTYNWVLTAAHCINRFELITIHIGTINRMHIRSVWSGNITNKNDLIVHPRYNPTNHINDIALVKLSDVKSSILNHQHVSTVLLPSGRESSVNLVGMDGTVSGFGSHSDTNKASEFLRFVTMPIISNLQCKQVFGNFITATHLCMSGSGGRSVCSGDSGGPLTVEISPGRNVVVGVVSFGHKHGCTLGHPGVFTRVSSYLSWIESHIGTIPRDSFLETDITEDELEQAADAANNMKISQILLIIGLIVSVIKF